MNLKNATILLLLFVSFMSFADNVFARNKNIRVNVTHSANGSARVDTVNCQRPVITSIGFNPINHRIQVWYNLPTPCDTCTIYVYGVSNNLITSVTNICGTTGYMFKFLDTCTYYKFLIKCHSDTCGTLVSDTGYYNGPSHCSTKCQRPVITSISLNPGYRRIQVWYNLPTPCDTCTIFVYNISNILITSVTNICGTTSTLFTTLDTCTYYKFLIKCHSDTCGTLVSDTGYYNGCKGIVNPIIPLRSAVNSNNKYSEVFHYLTMQYVFAIKDCANTDIITFDLPKLFIASIRSIKGKLQYNNRRQEVFI